MSDYNYITATFPLINYRINKYNKTSLVFRSISGTHLINKERQLMMNHQVVPIDGITENDEDSMVSNKTCIILVCKKLATYM